MPAARIVVWLLAGFLLLMAARHGRAFLRGRQGFELMSAVFWGLLSLRLLTGVPLLTWAALVALVAQLLLRLGAGRAAGQTWGVRITDATAKPRQPTQLPPAGSSSAAPGETSGSDTTERPLSPEAELGDRAASERERGRTHGEESGPR